MLLKSTLEKKNSVVLNDVQFLLLPCTIYIAPADLVTSKFSTSHTYNSTSHTYNIHITRRISPCAMYIVRVGCRKCTCHQMYVLQDFLFFSVYCLKLAETSHSNGSGSFGSHITNFHVESSLRVSRY